MYMWHNMGMCPQPVSGVCMLMKHTFYLCPQRAYGYYEATSCPIFCIILQYILTIYRHRAYTTEAKTLRLWPQWRCQWWQEVKGLMRMGVVVESSVFQSQKRIHSQRMHLVMSKAIYIQVIACYYIILVQYDGYYCTSIAWSMSSTDKTAASLSVSMNMENCNWLLTSLKSLSTISSAVTIWNSCLFLLHNMIFHTLA